MASTDNVHLMNKMLNALRMVATPEHHVDVSEFAKILQAINFRVKSSGEFPMTITEECNNDKTAFAGVTIKIMCHRSRHQVVLQRDGNADCTCTAVDEARGSWQVTAVTSGSRQSLVEETSGAYPPLGADVAATVRRLMECVGALVTGRMMMPLPVTSTPFPGDRRMHMARLSLGATEEKQSSIAAFAARYRSLDTLIDTDKMPENSVIPKPGILLKPPSQSFIAADASKAKSESSLMQPAPEKRVISPSPLMCSSDILACLLSAQEYLGAQSRNLDRAIALCRQDTTESLKEVQVEEPKTTLNTTTRLTKSTKLAVRPTISSLPKTNIASNSATASKTKMATAPKSLPKTNIASNSATASKTKRATAPKRYTHVKSTIPKPATKH